MNELNAGICGAYMGCHIIDKYSEGETHKMVGVSDYEGNLEVVTKYGDTDWWNISICKLILTPIERVSDEDCMKIAELADLPLWYRKEHFTCDCENMVTIGRAISHDLIEDYGDPHKISPSNALKIIDYLRSKHYDVGYGPIKSLITAGIAREKEETNA